MATILLSDPDEKSRVMLASLIEALGHRVVYDLGLDRVDAAVIEPASQDAMGLVRQARARRRLLPVVCVSARRRTPTARRLAPVAYIDKPVPVGPFVRALTTAVGPRRSLRQAEHEALAAA
ncbi:MAG TPA: hypothetical protein VFJ77_06690 [Gaiellaceae bacterium]|nr:hypothetical protein [Gaiellaceae bacterium]